MSYAWLTGFPEVLVHACIFPPGYLHFNETQRPEFKVGKEVSNTCQLQQKCSITCSSEFGGAPASRHSRRSAVMFEMPEWLGKGGARAGRPMTLGCLGSFSLQVPFQFRNFMLNFKCSKLPLVEIILSKSLYIMSCRQHPCVV